MEELLAAILVELKEMRYILQERKKAPSGGAFPATPEVVMNKNADQSWSCEVPGSVRWKDCKDGCGAELGWVVTQFGPRPIEKNGKQHRCPNYVPGAKRVTDTAPPKPLDDNTEVPF